MHHPVVLDTKHSIFNFTENLLRCFNLSPLLLKERSVVVRWIRKQRGKLRHGLLNRSFSHRIIQIWWKHVVKLTVFCYSAEVNDVLLAKRGIKLCTLAIYSTAYSEMNRICMFSVIFRVKLCVFGDNALIAKIQLSRRI